MGAKRTDERLYGGGIERVQMGEHPPYASYESPGPPTTVTVGAQSDTDQRLYGATLRQESGQASALYHIAGLTRVAGVPLADTAREAIKVLVVDDHHIVREGICALLRLQKDMQVVGEAVNGQEALEKVRQLLPDVVLMDMRMPVLNGLDAAAQLSAEGMETKVLMLTQYDEEANVLASRKAGAWGFVPKRSAGPDLIAGIRSVNLGKPFFTSRSASFARMEHQSSIGER